LLDNIADYIWYLIGIVAIIFLRGVISEASKDAWSWLKNKFFVVKAICSSKVPLTFGSEVPFMNILDGPSAIHPVA